MHALRITLVALALLAVWTGACPDCASAASFQSASDLRPGSIPDDAFLSGQQVTVSKPVTGELFAAGQTVAVSQHPSRSAVLAGQSVNVSGAGYDLFAAAQQLKVSGSVGHDAYLAGDSVTVAPGTAIKGDAYVSGGTVTLSGTIVGDAYVNADRLVVNHAVINGTLHYISPSTAVFSASKIRSVQHSQPQPQNGGATSFLVSLFAAILAAGTIGSLYPGLIEQASRDLSKRYLGAWGVGLLSLPAAFLLAGLLVSILIGYKLALLLLVLYGVALLLAGSLSILVVGRYILRRINLAQAEVPWLQSIVGSLLLIGAAALPGMGLVLWLLLFVPCLGSLLLASRPN